MRQVCVTRQIVLDFIKQSTELLDTHTIAAALSTEDKLIPERSVRAAVTWLILAEFLVKHVKPVIRISPTVEGKKGQPYKVWLYSFTGKGMPIRETRRNLDERNAQKWGETNASGVYLQNLFLKIGKGK